MKYLIAITIIGVLTFSCRKENLKKLDGVNYPTENQDFDVNGNGVADFYLRFDQVSTKDIPVSNSVITGQLHEYNSTAVLPHSGGMTFNLSKGDTLKRLDGFIDLVYHNRVVFTRTWDGERWEEDWSINAEEEGTYYLGYDLADGSTDDLGWVEFDIDKKDASITIINSQHTSGDYIIVE